MIELLKDLPKEVIWQFINFTLFVGLLFFLLRKKVISYFKERETHFKQALIRAERARGEAEEQKSIIKQKLDKLEASAAADRAQAQKDSEELKVKILTEAKELVANLKKETERTAESEIQRAKLELRDELLSAAIDQAKKILKEKVNEPDQKRLQDEFVEKIQVVRQ